MSRARYLVGDVFDRLAELPDGSVDLIVTSPPFLALRSYLPADHPDKHKEIGSEPTPAAFLDTLLALTAEWRRVLAPHGSIAVELGDTYASTGGTTDNRKRTNGGNDLAPRCRRGNGPGWPQDKSLALIPTLYPASLAYGRNLLNPDTTCEPWRVRNLLVWARPNPPVGAQGDKWRPATSYVTVACPGSRRYFDIDAVRTSSGAPPLDWIDERDMTWQPLMPLTSQPYKGAHHATFPSKLPARIIECMCPQRVCTICGTPSTRTGPDTWTDCGHDAWRNGIVLDPFGGSGTTAVAATSLGRDAILIDIDERNADLARERVGMFLEVAS